MSLLDIIKNNPFEFILWVQGPFMLHTLVEQHPNLDSSADALMVFGPTYLVTQKPFVSMLVASSAVAGVEAAQKLGLLNGVGDPKDIAYGLAGAVAAYLLSKGLNYFKQRTAGKDYYSNEPEKNKVCVNGEK